MFNDLANKAFRIAFLAENIKAGLAFQIRALRERAKWSQPELAEKSAKTQSVISRLENPNYGKYTISTLLDMARAFDVALLIKFVPYSRLIAELQDLSPKGLAVDNYSQEKERMQQQAARQWSAEYDARGVDTAKAASELAGRNFRGLVDLLNQETNDETNIDQSSASDLAFPTRRLKSTRQSFGEIRLYGDRQALQLHNQP